MMFIKTHLYAHCIFPLRRVTPRYPLLQSQPLEYSDETAVSVATPDGIDLNKMPAQSRFFVSSCDTARLTEAKVFSPEFFFNVNPKTQPESCYQRDGHTDYSDRNATQMYKSGKFHSLMIHPNGVVRGDTATCAQPLKTQEAQSL